MVAAKLLVERGSLRDQSEDWGDFTFTGLPSPADRLAVSHEGALHYLTVLCVHHQPVRQDEGAPSAAVVAKWTGSG